MSIHPTAIIEEGAQLGAGCVIHPYAVIRRHSILGPGVVVHPFAVVGGDPQYLQFDPATVSQVRIGEGTVLREQVTVNRSIHAGRETVVGARCFLMAGSHVGHDCVLGDQVVLANNAMAAGHVEIGSHTFVGGGAGLHQFIRLGEGVMVGGLTRLTKDVAPFLLVAERDEVPGFNLVGLKRRGFSREAIRELKSCFTRVFADGDPRVPAGVMLAAGVQSPEARRFLEFFTAGKRGFARPERTSATDET